MNIIDAGEILDLDPDILSKATEGDDKAQFLLGKAYFQATHVENNCFIAFKYLFNSANQGNMEAQFRLANLFALGQGAKQSSTEAYKWYTRAAIQGYKKALIRIHNLFQEDKRMHCRGRINAQEKEFVASPFDTGPYRDLAEYRLYQQKPILNGATEYYMEQFKYYQTVADQQDQETQLNMGFLYQHGYGTRKYTRWAIEYYTMAAEQGHVDAQYNLGHLYQSNSLIKFNYQKSIKWYTLAAEGGSIAAQNALAYLHLKGLATDINYDTALFWYTKAANAGHSEAQVTLGKLYRDGRYIKPNIAKAVEWYSLAASQNNSVAQNCLDQLYQTGKINEMKAVDLEYTSEGSRKSRLCSKLRMDISKMEKEGEKLSIVKKLEVLAQHALMADGNAMFQIGLKYYYGIDLVHDKDTGFKWILNAGKAGSQEALLKIASIYEEGEEDTVQQDYYKASVWYKAGVKQKNDIAQCHLGLLYDKGLGVRHDPLEASKWFTFSANQGNSNAKYQLGILRCDGRGLRQDYVEAVEWFIESAIQRNASAFISLGKLYKNGFGVKKNKSKSLNMYTYAEKFGDMNIHWQLGSIYGDKRGEEYDHSKSNEHYIIAADLGNMDAQYELAIRYLNGDTVERDYLKAFRQFKKLADNGHQDATWLFQTPIGICNGIRDIGKVVDMFIQARETNIAVNIEYNIGFIYEKGVTYSYPNIPQDHESALKWYLIAAINGDPKAQCRLGIMYEEGKGTDVDFKVAISYYRQACSSENTDAIYRLACMYRDGRGISQDPVKAFYLFTTASHMGHMLAHSVLILFEDASPHPSHPNYFNIYEKKFQIIYENTINMLETMAILGTIAVQYQLGNFFENEDDNKAFEWFTLASQGDITDTFYRLGILYKEGRGTEQNYQKAISNFQKATIKDHEEALYQLAHVYQYGIGIDCDYIKAYQLYTRAAEFGHTLAYKVLNITKTSHELSNEEDRYDYFDESSDEFKNSILMCEFVGESGDINMQYKLGTYYEITKSTPDYSMALKWYTMAAKNAHSDARYRLGLLYEKGLGTEQDYQKSNSLYSLAREQGNDYAIYRLGIAFHFGKGVEVNFDKALQNYIYAADLGNSESQYTLGFLYEMGQLVKKNTLTAVIWYTKAYANNNNDAVSSLHKLYHHEPYEAFFHKKLFQILSKFEYTYKSTDASYKDTYGIMYYRLGRLYNEGKGVALDYESALRYFSLAAHQYLNSDARNITRLYFTEENLSSKNQYLKMIETFWVIRESIEKVQQCILGLAYYYGVDVLLNKENLCNQFSQNLIGYPIATTEKKHTLGTLIPIDYPRAYEYFMLSAANGNRIAQFKLADMYFQGLGVERDQEKAIQMYSDLTNDDQGHLSCYISEMFQAGMNDVQDFSKALEYNKNVQGFNTPYALNDLGLLYEYGDGVEQSYEEAVNRYRQSAEYRNKGACFNLGLVYYFGKGVDKNYEEALNWFGIIAGGLPGSHNSHVYVKVSDADNGEPKKHTYSIQGETIIYGEVHYYLGVMFKNGLGTQINQRKAEHHFKMASEFYHLGQNVMFS